jgi:LysM repeat protein
MTDEIPALPPKKKLKAPLKPMASPPLKNPASTISSYRKRQQVGPFIIWGLVVLLLVAGIILLVVWLASGNGPKISLFATQTPTATITSSPTITATVTPTVTETIPPTETLSPTPSEPFEYAVQEGETLSAIAEKFALGDLGIQKLFILNPEIDQTTANVSIGQKIKIPNPDFQLPTMTPIPTNLAYGARINYIIQPGDTIASIAATFNSTFEDILKENKITDANKIQAFQQIVVRANLVTPTNPPKPTITPGASPTPPSPFTPTPPGAAPFPTVSASPTK